MQESMIRVLDCTNMITLERYSSFFFREGTPMRAFRSWPVTLPYNKKINKYTRKTAHENQTNYPRGLCKQSCNTRNQGHMARRGEATVRGEQVAHYLHKSPVGRVKPVLFNEPTLLIPKTQLATSPCQGEESQDRILKHCFASSPSFQRVLFKLTHVFGVFLRF